MFSNMGAGEWMITLLTLLLPLSVLIALVIWISRRVGRHGREHDALQARIAALEAQQSSQHRVP